MRIPLLLLVFVTLPLTAQVPRSSAAPEPSSSSVSPMSAAAGLDPLSREDLLQAQLTTMKELHESLLDTVHWALSAVGAMTVVLVGYGWITNFRLADRERKALGEELHGAVVREFASARNELVTETAKIPELVKKALQGSIQNATTPLQRQLRNLAFDLAGIEVWRYRQEAVPANTITALRKHALIALESGHAWAVDDDLAEMEDLLRAGAGLRGQDVGDLDGFLQRLPVQHEVIRERLRELLRTQ